MRHRWSSSAGSTTIASARSSATCSGSTTSTTGSPRSSPGSPGEPVLHRRVPTHGAGQGAAGLRRRGRWRVGTARVPRSLTRACRYPGRSASSSPDGSRGSRGPRSRSSSYSPSWGARSNGALLERATPLDDDATLGAIGELLARQVLDEDRDGKFRFVHDKLREIAYERIDVDRRRELHRRVPLRSRPPIPALITSGATTTSWRSTGRGRSTLTCPRAGSGRQGGGAPRPSRQRSRPSRPPARRRRLRPRGGPTPRRAIPSEPAEIASAIATELAGITRLQAGRQPADLLELPSSHDPDTARVIGILLSIHPAAHESRQFDLFAHAWPAGT